MSARRGRLILLFVALLPLALIGCAIPFPDRAFFRVAVVAYAISSVLSVYLIWRCRRMEMGGLGIAAWVLCFLLLAPLANALFVLGNWGRLGRKRPAVLASKGT